MRSIRVISSMFSVQALCLATLSVPAALPAEELVISLDAAKTKIGFVVGSLLHTVHGTFQLKGGHISFDPSTGIVSGDITVDAASGNSGNTTRDKRMTRGILEAQRYPEVRFSPTAYKGSVAMTGTSNVEVTGSFLIHGQAHEITIPLQIQMSREEVTATGKFTVPYVQWGMKNPSNFLLKVDDKVEIELTAMGRVNGLRAP
jgi:polyisoprenoid-binding protein YceI